MDTTTHKRTYLAAIRKGVKGFTLVEILMVIAIIAILAAIAVPRFTTYRLKAYKSQLDSDSKNIYTAAQAYLVDNQSATITSLGDLIVGGYQQSGSVGFLNASMSQTGGNIEIISSTLNGLGLDNNAVIFANGTIFLVNAP